MKYFLAFFCLLLVFSCKGQKGPIMSNIPNFKPEEQIVYAISIGIHHKFDLYINDIKATNNNVGYMAIDINPYVLGNGKYKIKVILYPEDTSKAFLDNTRIQLVKYLKDTKGEYVDGSRAELKMLPVVYPSNNQNPFVQEWEVELTEIPYKLEGWSKGQDLSKMDKKVLEEKVVKYYQGLREILNTGKSDEWMELIHKRLEETWTFDYTKNKENTYENSKKAVVDEYKNNMLTLEDYEMKIYGEGKLVTLERNATKEFQGYKENIKGWSPLISNEEGLISNISIILYLPESSDEFVIIRK